MCLNQTNGDRLCQKEMRSTILLLGRRVTCQQGQVVPAPYLGCKFAPPCSDIAQQCPPSPEKKGVWIHTYWSYLSTKVSWCSHSWFNVRVFGVSTLLPCESVWGVHTTFDALGEWVASAFEFSQMAARVLAFSFTRALFPKKPSRDEAYASRHSPIDQKERIKIIHDDWALFLCNSSV